MIINKGFYEEAFVLFNKNTNDAVFYDKSDHFPFTDKLTLESLIGGELYIVDSGGGLYYGNYEDNFEIISLEKLLKYVMQDTKG